ncbi:MAG: 6,7-dimethyl-8-ribityllumazine synthase [Candidatus Hodgkinia cicadicola]
MVRDLRVLILVSCCHVYLTDLALRRLIDCLNAHNVSFVVAWFFGVYDLDWILNSSSSRYCGYVVLGFVLKGISAHNVYVTMSVFNNILHYPVVNAICSLNCVELAWEKAFNLNVVELTVSLWALLGTSVGLASSC